MRWQYLADLTPDVSARPAMAMTTVCSHMHRRRGGLGREKEIRIQSFQSMAGTPTAHLSSKSDCIDHATCKGPNSDAAPLEEKTIMMLADAPSERDAGDATKESGQAG